MTGGMEEAYDTRERCRACGVKVHPFDHICPNCLKDVRGKFSEEIVRVRVQRFVRLKIITQFDEPCRCTEVVEVDAAGNMKGFVGSRYWQTEEELRQGTAQLAAALQAKPARVRLVPTQYKLEEV